MEMSERQYQIYAKVKNNTPQRIVDILNGMDYEFRAFGDPTTHDAISKFADDLREKFPLFDIEFRIILPPDVDEGIEGQEIRTYGTFGTSLDEWADGWDEALKKLWEDQKE